MFLTKGLVEELVFVSFFFLDLCRALASTRTASPAHLLRRASDCWIWDGADTQRSKPGGS